MAMQKYILGLIAAAMAWGSSACEMPEAVTQLRAEEVACLQVLYYRPADQWPAPDIDVGIEWLELAALPEIAPAPPGNPSTPEKIALGEKLFFDAQLSRNKDIACADCHTPAFGFADERKVSVGHLQQKGRRNSPSVVASGLLDLLFWDGRVQGLEAQALKPVEDLVEMAFTVDELVLRLRESEDYQRLFAEIFDMEVEGELIAKALASYQRSLLPKETDFEYFMSGEYQAFTSEQLHGLHIFRTKGRCMNCHHGAALSDGQFHNLGLTYYGRKYEDLGRYEVTGKAEDVGRFRTPSLRSVSKTKPWMHNGLFPSLQGIINMYDAGMPQPKPKPDQPHDPLFPKTSPILRKLELSSQERRSLEAFLHSL